MKISHRIALNQRVFIGALTVFIVVESMAYLHFQKRMASSILLQEQISKTRMQVTDLFDHYVDDVIHTKNISQEELLEKTRDLNQQINALFAQLRLPDKNTPPVAASLQFFKENFAQVTVDEEQFIKRIPKIAPPTMHDDLATLLHFDRSKRSIISDILGFANVAVTQDVQATNAAMRWNYIALMVFAALAILGVFIAKRYFDRIVVAPLGELNERLTRLTKGESDIRSTIDATPEIGDVLKNFDSMRDSLNESNERLRDANKKLEEFASIAAHDLRSPIASIDGYLQLAADASHHSESERQTYILHARRIAARSMKMLENLLNYAKASSATPKSSVIHIESTIKDVLEDLDSPIKNSSAKITLHNLGQVYADPQMLYELLLNLIGNSIKYRRAGTHPEVSLWQNKRTINGRIYDELCVTDNGIGFDMAEKDEILKPFRRLSSAAGYEGSGLGLSVCAQIMRSHHGFLDYSSLIGVGSTFSALFPAAKRLESAPVLQKHYPTLLNQEDTPYR